MDKVKVKRLELEIEELNRVQDEGENQDTVDGFRKFVSKQLHKICSFPGKNQNKTVGASYLDGTKRSKVEGEGDADLADIYDFNHRERGLAIIINNEDFSLTESFDDRPGSSCDAMALYETFKNLGFRVWVKKNLKSWQIVQVLKLGGDEYDHRNADCFVCAILSHGNETIVKAEHERLGVRKDLLIGTDGKAVSMNTVVELFSDGACPDLMGKPRLFFIQACRGEKYDDGVAVTCIKQTACTSENDQPSYDGTDHGNTQDTSNRPHESSSNSSSESQHLQIDDTDANPVLSEESIEKKMHDVNLNATSSGYMDVTDAQRTPVSDVIVSPAPLYKDSLIMYATPPGYFAWRRKTGAWFIQSLCRVLNNPEVGNRSLLSALTHVVGIVAMDYQSEAPSKSYMHHKKETPVIESMLVKDVFFTPK